VRIWGIVLLLAGRAAADAIVTVDAMNASTIAEIFVEKGGVRVELEIAVRDIPAFADLLPEEMQGRLDPPERRWAVLADGGELTAERNYSARKRRKRDPITGEPMGETEERVVVITLRYPLAAQPDRLTLHAPSGASIGFVLYHEGIAVNDFRYLPAEATVTLDWSDPWFSRFGHRNLRRRFDAPVSCFLYVEPYEIRKEVVLRPRDLESWMRIEFDETIPVEAQPELKQRIVEFLKNRAPVLVDGKPAEFALDRVEFVRRTLRQTGVIDPPEPLNASAATLGIIFHHPRDGTLPQKVSMRWDLFPPQFAYVPASVSDEAGGLPTRLTADDPVLVWENFLKNPTPAGFLELPPARNERAFPWVTLALAVVAVPFALRRKFAVALVLLVAAGFFWPRASEPEASPAIVGDLLRNVYRAFDFRGEETIYDALARSVAGPALQQSYLDIRKSLEIQNQGGARVKVREVKMVWCKQSGAEADCLWEVTGSVGHWGHLHTRANRYEAGIDVRPVDGVWKITRMEVRDEQRLR
jgi:hypothetical protein